MIDVREIASPYELELCHAMRRKVFVDEQKVPEAEEWDDLDGQAQHLLAFEGERPVGTARLRKLNDLGKIERVCVLAEARGTGAGRALINAALKILRADATLQGAKLGAQMHALGFYESFGFAAYGPEYLDGGIPHRDMEVRF